MDPLLAPFAPSVTRLPILLISCPRTANPTRHGVGTITGTSGFRSMQSPGIGPFEEITEIFLLTYKMDESISRVLFISEKVHRDPMHLFKILPAGGGESFLLTVEDTVASPCPAAGPPQAETHAIFSRFPLHGSLPSPSPPPISWGPMGLLVLTVSLSGVFPLGNSPCRTSVGFYVCKCVCLQ